MITTSLMTFDESSWSEITGWTGQIWSDMSPIIMPILGVFLGILLITLIIDTIIKTIAGSPDESTTEMGAFSDEYKKRTGRGFMGGKTPAEKGREKAKELADKQGY